MSVPRHLLPALLAVCLACNAAAAANTPDDGAACAGAVANLFPAQNWLPPPAPPSPKRIEVPKAPPLPFAYLGQMEEGKGITLFLAHGQRTLVVRPGDGIDGRYRVAEITPARATFIYLPLNETQHLTLQTRP